MKYIAQTISLEKKMHVFGITITHCVRNQALLKQLPGRAVFIL